MAVSIRKPALPSVVDASITTTVGGQTVTVLRPTAQTPAYVQRVTALATKDPTELARVVERMSEEQHQVTAAQRAHPMQAVLTIKNVTLTSGATTILPPHGLNSLVHWLVVRWRGAAGGSAGAGASLEEDQGATTVNALALKSYVSGVADVMVWPIP